MPDKLCFDKPELTFLKGVECEMADVEKQSLLPMSSENVPAGKPLSLSARLLANRQTRCAYLWACQGNASADWCSCP